MQLMEIKRLNASMATIRSQLNKYEEQVEECRRYQKFLDSVTPVEWQEQQKQARLARQQQRHAAWLLQCEALKKQKQDAKGGASICNGDSATKFRRSLSHQCTRCPSEQGRSMHPSCASLRVCNAMTWQVSCSSPIKQRYR